MPARSPRRPPAAAGTDRAAQPDKRAITCPHCEKVLDVDAKAISVACRHCSKRVVVEDMTIDSYYGVVRLATAGSVVVGKSGHLAAKVRVERLVVKGTVKGDVTAVERIEVGSTGKVYGDLRTRRLLIEPGAVVVGRVEIGPPPAAAEGR